MIVSENSIISNQLILKPHFQLKSDDTNTVATTYNSSAWRPWGKN